MKDTAELLQVLADKFGTTIEHLWSVMINQAFIDGTISSLVNIFLIVVLVVGFKFVKAKTTASAPTESNLYPMPEFREFEAAWGIYGILALVAIIIIISLSYNIATAFLNPEYWALQQIKS